MKKLNTASTMKPQPYPSISTSGTVVRGRKAPIKHRVTMTAVMAEAEYTPKASTTYAMTGIVARRMAAPIRVVAKSRIANGSLSSVDQP